MLYDPHSSQIGYLLKIKLRLTIHPYAYQKTGLLRT